MIDCLLVSIQRTQNVAEVIVRLRKIRPDLDGLCVMAHRLLGPIEGLEQMAEVVARIGVVGNAGKQGPVELLGFVQSADLVEGYRLSKGFDRRELRPDRYCCGSCGGLVTVGGCPTPM